LLHGRPRFGQIILRHECLRALFAVANLLVELSSEQDAPRNYQHNNVISIILTAVHYNQIRFRSELCPEPCCGWGGSWWRSPYSVFGWGWGHPPPLATPRRFQCLVLCTWPFKPFTKAFPSFLLYEI